MPGNRAQLLIIDISESPELAEKYEVKVVPTFVAVKDETETWRTKGLVSEDELSEFMRASASAATAQPAD